MWLRPTSAPAAFKGTGPSRSAAAASFVEWERRHRALSAEMVQPTEDEEKKESQNVFWDISLEHEGSTLIDTKNISSRTENNVFVASIHRPASVTSLRPSLSVSFVRAAAASCFLVLLLYFLVMMPSAPPTGPAHSSRSITHTEASVSWKHTTEKRSNRQLAWTLGSFAASATSNVLRLYFPLLLVCNYCHCVFGPAHTSCCSCSPTSH